MGVFLLAFNMRLDVMNRSCIHVVLKMSKIAVHTNESHPLAKPTGKCGRGLK